MCMRTSSRHVTVRLELRQLGSLELRINVSLSAVPREWKLTGRLHHADCCAVQQPGFGLLVFTDRDVVTGLHRDEGLRAK